MNNNLESEHIKRLLFSHNLFSAGRVFFEIFLNIYIWKQTQDIVLVAWFNIIYLLMHTLSFSFFAKYVKKGEIHFPRKLSLIGFVIVFLFVYFLGESLINYVLLIAFFVGILNGLYWISYQLLRFDMTNTKNRGNYAGWEFGLKTGTDLIMPVLGGFIISLYDYPPVFLLGALLFIISFFVGNIPFNLKETKELHLKKSWKIIKKDKDIMNIFYSYFFGTFGKDGSLRRVLLPLFIFAAVAGEFELGFWLSFFSFVAIIASILIGKKMHYKVYRLALSLGGLAYASLISLLIYFPSMITYLIYGTLTQVITLFIKIPKRVISENMIHKIENYQEHRVEYLVCREWFNIGFGRIASFIFLLFVSGISAEELKIPLMIIAAGVILEVYFLIKVKTDFSKL